MHTATAFAIAATLCLTPHPASLDDRAAPVVGRSLRSGDVLPCEIEHGARGSVVHLGNDTGRELVRGARIAWITTGTAAAQGHWQWLGRPLLPGGRLSVRTGTTLHADACTATLRGEGQRSPASGDDRTRGGTRTP